MIFTMRPTDSLHFGPFAVKWSAWKLNVRSFFYDARRSDVWIQLHIFGSGEPLTANFKNSHCS
jgi:hypothetical protein